MGAPVIAVVANVDTNRFSQPSDIIPLAYTTSIEKAGAIPLILPFTRNHTHLPVLAGKADGFIFPGGFDVFPGFYNEPSGPRLVNVDKNLDLFQIELANRVMAAGKPVLGICRGAQVVNVALGGTLVQDIPAEIGAELTHMQKTLSYDTDHTIDIEEGSRLYELFGPRIPVNSRHHQSIRTPGKGLKITARAPDGVVEAAEHTGLPVDLVQWHPELLMQKDNRMLPLFKAFAYRCM